MKTGLRHLTQLPKNDPEVRQFDIMDTTDGIPMCLPSAVDDPLYRKALEADVISKARRLVIACRASDKRRHALANKISEGNRLGMFGPEGTRKGVLIRDVDT